MRPYHLIAAATAAALSIGAAAPAFAAGGVVVRIDEATPVRLSGSAAQIVVGNPSIADATLVDHHQVMVLGRSYGSTSLTVFDGAGRAIYSGLVTVGAPGSNHVSLYRGALNENFTCASHCERNPMPGEPTTIYQGRSQGYQDYASRAKQASQGQGDN